MPDQLHTVLEQTLGYQLIGAFLSICLYGITVLQTYLYFIHFHGRDSITMRSLVFVLWILDTACSALVAHSLYIVLVRDWGVVESLVKVPVTFTLENGMTCLVTVIVQCFFAHRVWLVSGRTGRLIPALITVLALACFGSGLALTSRIFIKHNTVEAVEHDRFVDISCILDQGIAAFVDIVITISLCLYLDQRSSKSLNTSRVNSTLQKLTAYFITRGILTALIQVLAVVTFSALHTQEVWMLWHLTLSKVYVNSMLAILNSRDHIRKTLDGHSRDLGGGQISNIRFEPASSNTGDQSESIQVAPMSSEKETKEVSIAFPQV